MRFLLSVTVFTWLMAWAKPAHAYLDPGTGSLILQLVLGGVAGALVVVKLYWNKLKSLFVRTPAGDAVTESKQLRT